MPLKTSATLSDINFLGQFAAVDAHPKNMKSSWEVRAYREASNKSSGRIVRGCNTPFGFDYNCRIKPFFFFKLLEDEL